MSELTLGATLLCVLVALTACDEPTDRDGALDGGPEDAGSADMGRFDMGGLDAAADAAVGDAGSDMPPPLDCVGPPGLYADVDCTLLAAGVEPFTPRFELWSDDADKKRFVHLPPGTQIDTSDPDRWGFPMGTRLYKTFLRDGVRLETRVFEKTMAERSTTSWVMRSWLWSEDQRSVTEVGPFGEENVLGTTHDIPTRGGCISCHSVAQDDIVMGFSAVQLAHSGEGVTLDSLRDDGRLTDPIGLADTAIPGDDTARAALGYLHANCGNCHGGPEPERGLDLWLPVGPAAALESSAAFATSVCVCSEWADVGPGGETVDLRIFPGDAVRSVLTHRMGSREQTTMMPPLATEQVDTDGRQLVIEWIDSLPSDAGGCPADCL